MISQESYYGGGFGTNSVSRVFLHPGLARVYWVGNDTDEVQLPNASHLELGTKLVIIIATGPRASDLDVYQSDGISLNNTLTSGLAVYTLTTQSQTGWSHYVRTYNSSARTYGATTRPDTLANTVSANARAAVPVPFCGVWQLVKCSGDDQGGKLFSRQDFNVYSGQYIQLSSDIDPNREYRLVEPATTITGPVDTRDLLSQITAGPVSYCASDLAVGFYGTQQGSSRDAHFATTDGTSLPVGFDTGGSVVDGVGKFAYRGNVLAALENTQLNIYNTQTDTNVTVDAATDFNFIRTNSKHQVAIDSDGDVYIRAELLEDGGSTRELYIHSYTSAGALRWSTEIPTSLGFGDGPAVQSISNVAGNVVGVLTLESGGQQLIRVFNATTGAALYNIEVFSSSALEVDIRTTGSLWFVFNATATSSWTNHPGGGLGDVDIAAYLSNGDWSWGFATTTGLTTKANELSYGADGFLYIAMQRNSTWTGAGGQNATLLKITTGGIVTDHYDDATNFPNAVYTSSADADGNVVVAGDTDTKVALLDGNLDQVWLKNETDFFSGVSTPGVALRGGAG